MDYEELKRHIPHRPPFLLIDEILETSADRIVARKTFSGNEGFFQGHFPGDPRVPQVYFIEAAGQAAGVHAALHYGLRGATIVVSGVRNASFSTVPVKPGDSVLIEVMLVRFGGKVATVHAKASVGSHTVMEADLTGVVV